LYPVDARANSSHDRPRNGPERLCKAVVRIRDRGLITNNGSDPIERGERSGGGRIHKRKVRSLRSRHRRKTDRGVALVDRVSFAVRARETVVPWISDGRE